MNPCPFCGERDKLVIDSDIESVVCNGCGATGPSFLDAPESDDETMNAEIVRGWNTRSTPK